MRPGDLVRCSRCGREATAYFTGDPARWHEGDALTISWDGYRHEAALHRPEVCLFCRDVALGAAPWTRQAPTRRVAIMDDLALAGCRVVGFEWATDERVEDAYQSWVAAGRPRCALVRAENPGARPAAAAPLPRARARRAQLALF